MDAMAVARADAPKICLPILIQHGEADRLTAPAGSRYLFENVASKDKRLEIYPGLFHEIYNEPEQGVVLDDLIGWFDAHVAQHYTPVRIERSRDAPRTRTDERRVGKECVSTCEYR